MRRLYGESHLAVIFTFSVYYYVYIEILALNCVLVYFYLLFSIHLGIHSEMYRYQLLTGMSLTVKDLKVEYCKLLTLITEIDHDFSIIGGPNNFLANANAS